MRPYLISSSEIMPFQKFALVSGTARSQKFFRPSRSLTPPQTSQVNTPAKLDPRYRKQAGLVVMHFGRSLQCRGRGCVSMGGCPLLLPEGTERAVIVLTGRLDVRDRG